MPRALLLASVILATAAACAARGPLPLAERTGGRDVVLAVVTWNVNAGRGDLPALVDDLRAGALTGGTPVDDFIVLLQENIAGSPYDAVPLARERGLSASFVPVRESDRGVSGNAILSTRPLQAVREIELPRIRRVRKALMATFDIRGRSLFAVCTHFENRTGWLQGALFSDVGRRRQAEALLAELPDGPGVLGGDLNTWLPGEPAWRALVERFDDTPADRLTPTFRERLVLDHLFFDLPPDWEALHEVVTARYGSDHHPVLGIIVEKQSGADG